MEEKNPKTKFANIQTVSKPTKQRITCEDIKKPKGTSFRLVGNFQVKYLAVES